LRYSVISSPPLRPVYRKKTAEAIPPKGEGF
jgi:hypothetical protein